MPYNAAGEFVRVDNSFSNPDAGTAIDPGDASAFFDDIDLALNKTKTIHLSSQHDVSSTTAAEITGLRSFIGDAGTYRFSYWLIARSSTAGDGLTFGIDYTGTTTKLVAMLSWPDTGVIAALGAVDDAANAATGQLVAYAVTRTESTTAPNLSTGTAGVASTGADLFLKIEGVIVVSNGGFDFTIWHGSESTNSTTIEVGSSLSITRVN